MGSLVLVHKVPALWEIGAKRNNSDIQFSPDFEELSNLTESENKFLTSLKNDIFYILSRTIADYLGLEEIHVILCYEKNEIRNWDVIERNGMIKDEDFVSPTSFNPDEHCTQVQKDLLNQESDQSK